MDRKEAWADRVLLDAHRAAEEGEPRAHLAVGAPQAVVRDGDPDDPRAWVIF